MTSTAKTVRLGDLDHDPVVMAMSGQAERIKHLDDLLASIPEHGVLQSLKVRIAEDATRYLVTAGNRRFAALKALRDGGGAIRGVAVSDETQVPVLLSEETDDAAREQAVAENVQRVALTPGAEALQYAELARTAPVKEIAARFGVPEKRVRQRLKLASLHPEVLAALEAGTINIAAAEAFTVEEDPAKQLKYLQKADGNSWKLGAAEVRKALTKKLVLGSSPITSLVGRGAYLAAGGEIVEDPFDDTEYWTDGRLLDELAAKHWAGQVAAWEADGWAFVVEAKAYGPYFYPHHTVTPAEMPLEEAVEGERTGLIARLSELIGQYEIDPYEIEERTDGAVRADDLVENASDDVLPDPPEEVVAEVVAAVARLAAIAVASRSFTPEQKAGSGVVYWLDGHRPPVLGFIDEKRAAPPKEELRKGPKARVPSLDELPYDLNTRLRNGLFEALREKALSDPLFGLQILVARLHVALAHGDRASVSVGLETTYGARATLPQPERGKSFGAALNWAKQQDVSTLAEAAGSLVGELVGIGYSSEEGTAALVRLLRPEPHFDVDAYLKALTVPQLGLVWAELTGGEKLPEPKELAKRVAEGIREKGWLPPQLRTPDYKGPAGKPKKGKKKAADNDDDVPAIAAE